MRKRSDFLAVGDVLRKFDPTRDKYISREFQKYGYDLACELRDLSRVGLYIKLAKNYPRALLEQARYFVRDAKNVRSPAKLFMWKLTQLRKEMRLHRDKKAGKIR